MKVVALCAALLAISTTPAFSVCKHHASAPARVNDVGAASMNTQVVYETIK